MSDKKYRAVHRNGENNGWWDVVFDEGMEFNPHSQRGAMRLAAILNAMDEIKKFFDEAEHDSKCGGFRGWPCECWISKNKALFKTIEELGN